MIDQVKSALSNKMFKSFLVIVIFIPVIFINIKSSHNWGGDFAQYISQAKCICEGINQSETGYIFNDQNPMLGPPTYPIGFPLILTPVYFFFGNNMLAFSILIAVLVFLLAIVLVKLNKLYFTSLISLVAVVAFIYNPWVLRFKSQILSDIPFTLLFMLTVYIYRKLFNSEKLRIKNSIVLGLLIGFAVLIRSIGAVIILGIFMDKFVIILRNKKIMLDYFYNPLLIAGSMLAFYACFNFLIFPTETEHYSFFSTLFDFKNIGNVIKHSYNYYAILIKNFFSDDPILSSVTITLFLFGFIKKIIKDIDLIDYIFIIYLFIILIYPVVQGFRFLLPIYPFIAIYIVVGLKSIPLKLKKKSKYVIPMAFALFLFFIYLHDIKSILKYQKDIIPGPQADHSIEAFDFIKTKTDKDAVIAVIKPRVLALYTSRPSIGIGMDKSPEEIDKKFSDVGVDYVIQLEDKKNVYLENYISHNKSNLTLIWSNEKFKIYSRKK